MLPPSPKHILLEGKEMGSYRMLFIWLFSVSYMRTSASLVDSLTTNQSIIDGETLVSADGTFEAGFFSPGSSKGRYLGVWYTRMSPIKVVWVANRETPLQNRSGVLKVNEKGILMLLDGKNSTAWSSNTSSSKIVNNPIVQLLDSGNLVVKNGQDIINEDKFLWQSFDYPCDTLLPGMKIGWNLVTGLNRFVSSWRSVDDPAVGEYSVKIDPRGYPQVVALKGSVITTRAGSWNGIAFTGYPIYKLKQMSSWEFVLNEEEVYFKYELLDGSIFSMQSLTPSGNPQSLVFNGKTRSQEVFPNNQGDQCETYATCGANAICHVGDNSPTCECLKGFVPTFPEEWNISFWSNGCVRKTKLDCNYRDGFRKYQNMKLPDTASSWYSKTIDLGECQNLCLKNCSCTSYANLDISNGGSGCLLWFDDLIDMREFSHRGQDLYIRVHASELGHVAVNGRVKTLVGIAVGVIICGLTVCGWIIILRKRGAARISYRHSNHFKDKLMKEDVDLSTFDFQIIAKATESFSSSNKLGEGGFGPVYKGTLKDGQEIAVKRLSKKSGQGLEEFKNEVALIAKLQHHNLVKLIGCCIEGDEKLLIYEYMPNKSLDYFIFDETRRKLVDWLKRFNIIDGIARGLLCLHQDSRLRIVHRDLKTSNILLDANLYPKISDFGLARTFREDQVEANTNRVAGTFGYMPPEYVLCGHFSTKSDVFSYGVIVLEIVSGKKNREFSDPEHCLNLLGHAWRLWTKERALELLDEVLGERFTPSEVMRCIQVGLLCVQQRPEDRPDMSSVVLMLNGEKLLPNPKAPGFYTDQDVTPEPDSLPANCELFSSNEMSITILEAR